MIICACWLDLVFYESFSLKDKRKIMKSLKVKGQQKFGLSLAEVGDQDRMARGQLGCALVTQSKTFGDHQLQAFINFIETHYPVEIIALDTEDFNL